MPAQTVAVHAVINAFDPEALYDAAFQAHVGDIVTPESIQSARDFLGTRQRPALVNCLIEIWSQHTPVAAGYEFIRWEDNAEEEEE